MSFSRFEYLLVLILCFTPVALLVALDKYASLRNHLFQAIIAMGVVSVPFLIWDVYATWAGHWQFNPKFNLGFYLVNLPLEEVLFFFVVPFCCLFLWQVVKQDWQNRFKAR
jgi:lycopene cyclase domain-containing protein